MVSSSNEESISLFEGLERSDYTDNVKNVLASVFFDHFSQSQSKIYLLTKQIDQNSLMTNSFFVLQHKLRVPNGERVFDVPLLIYLTDAFPLGMPEIYIERRGNIEINQKLPKGLISSQDLRIHYEYYMKWSKTADGIIEVLRYLSSIFYKGFPVFASRKTIEYSGNCMLDFEHIVRVKLDQVSSSSDDSNVSGTTNANTSATISSKSSNGKYVNNAGGSSKDLNSDCITPGFDLLEEYTPKGNEKDLKEESMLSTEEIQAQLKDDMTNKLIKLLQSKQRKNKEMQKVLTQAKNDLEKTVKVMNEVFMKEKEILKLATNLPQKLEQNQNLTMTDGGYEELLMMPIENKCMEMLEIANPRTMKHLINEITLEEMLQLTKTLFDKKVIGLAEGIQTTRALSYQLFKMKEVQRLYSNQ